MDKGKFFWIIDFCSSKPKALGEEPTLHFEKRISN